MLSKKLAKCNLAKCNLAKCPTPVIAITTTTINNSIIWADISDLDIIRVEDTYYMVHTRMLFSPGAPIMNL
ncbi:hypothetical protein H8356DRAFT_1692143 [Neocallimastix lanati (nom. inval.)]|nr:hypothetical protein H8356DRAFT_1692143 [Neocallimastix sp. JGI-2020a]